MSIRWLLTFLALCFITNSDSIIFSSNITDNSTEWITSGSIIYVTNSECPTNSECWHLNGPNTEMYRYFPIQQYITNNDLEIMLEFNIHLQSFTGIDQYCLVQYTNNINSSWIDLLAYNGANSDVKLINESSFIPQLNGSIIGIKFLLRNTASFQSCFINEIRLIGKILTEPLSVQHIVSTIESDTIQTSRNDYEYQISATIDLYYHIASNITIERPYKLIKDIAMVLIIGFSTSSQYPFDDIISVDVITNSFAAENHLNMIASILTYTEHDANLLMQYIDGDFIIHLQNELHLQSITTLNISTDSTLKTLIIDNDDDSSENGDFLGISFELLWVIAICAGCCILICIAFIFGYYRGMSSTKNLEKIPSSNPSFCGASTRSIGDIERIKELELELRKAKSEQMELEQKAIHLDIERSKTFSPTLSSGIYHKPSTIFSEGDKSRAIITNVLDDNMILGDTNHRISMNHRKKQLSHIYESIEKQRIIQHDSDEEDEEDDYVEDDVNSDDFFVEPNTLNQEGVLTKTSMTKTAKI